MNSIPPKILLSYHQITRTRLSCASLPYGKSMTKWINDAICEKLDREQPETIGLAAAVPVEAPLDPAKILEERRRAARPLDFVGPYTLKYGKDETYVKMAGYRMDSARRKKQTLGLEDALEQVALVSGGELSEAEKVELMQAPPVPVVQPLENAPPVASDADFWGEDEADKVRALVKRHTR